MTIILLLIFITMVGGSPQHDAYGFHNWNLSGVFAEYSSSRDLGRFEGFLESLWTTVIVTGPEYVSSLVAETKHPRAYVKQAFEVVYFRSIVFSIGAATCVGILLMHDDPTLADVNREWRFFCFNVSLHHRHGEPRPHLPPESSLRTHVDDRLFCREYVLVCHNPQAIERPTNERSILIYCDVVALVFGCLSFLQLSDRAITVLNWLIDLTTANILIHYTIIAITYICFYRTYQKQNFDRTQLPYYGYFQPCSGYISLVWMVMKVFCFGYQSIRPWSLQRFFLNYTMLLLTPALSYSGRYFTEPGGWRLMRSIYAGNQMQLSFMKRAMPVKFWRDVFSMFKSRPFGSGEHANVSQGCECYGGPPFVRMNISVGCLSTSWGK
ncbi:amino acid permease/ SLC12A domain-containing protein [Penicillium argentinense]|uniref:Amino acid permease/ SLC12A domain-containing protein n=1 Tax=Penicillium argentinense TaxID=1131581 RepID=A0A9W9KA17_9EURO|nr:amino acid permease/ SLC12A domain-containing protein [Penicillium argentinense]KAJ5098520.1 amino acid permease/ SLC12A domain-containing protein [Penicillium argentinense]